MKDRIVKFENGDAFVAFSLPRQAGYNLYACDYSQAPLSDKMMKNCDFVVSPYDRSKEDPIYLNYKTNFGQAGFHLSAQKNYSGKPISYGAYEKDLQQCLNFIETGIIQKVVYSRCKFVPLYEVDIFQAFERLVAKYQEAFVYVFNIPGKGIWMGASPEVLLTGDNHKLLTTALAGTQKLDAKDLDQIRWSNKEIEEHAFIELFLESEFNGLEIDYSKSATYTKAAGKMCHIKSDFVLKSESRLNLVLNAIHPGPALSGYPKNAAMELLNKAEPHDREFYTGFLGPVGSDNKLHVYVNLRCMQVFKNGFLLYLGGGITKDSNPKSEWEETELKASTMESVLDTEEAIALKSQYDF